jgi:hypothetical protein
VQVTRFVGVKNFKCETTPQPKVRGYFLLWTNMTWLEQAYIMLKMVRNGLGLMRSVAARTDAWYYQRYYPQGLCQIPNPIQMVNIVRTIVLIVRGRDFD